MVPCPCQIVKEAERRMRDSGLADEIKQKTFRSFKAETPWQQEMKNTAIAYGKAYFKAREAGKIIPWLFISGNAGSGKTHLCTALCGGMLKKGIPVYYMQWVTESRRLRAIANEPDFDAMIAPFINVDVLYIDDLFKQPGHTKLNVTDAEGKVLFEILNNRYIQNKGTIISTEWYLESELMRLDDGTFSRVYERAKGFTVSVNRDEGKNIRINGIAGEGEE